MESILISYFSWWHPLGYILIFLGAFLEGDAVVFTTGFMAHREIIQPIAGLITLFTGAILGDIFWYFLGRELKNSRWFINRWVTKITEPFDDHIIKKPLKTIFVSKFTYGLHHPILMRAGALNVPFKTYIKNDIISSALWILVVGSLGFASGASYVILKRYLKYGEAAILLLFVMFFFLDYFIAKKTKKKL